jgi:hypothetical protein
VRDLLVEDTIAVRWIFFCVCVFLVIWEEVCALRGCFRHLQDLKRLFDLLPFLPGSSNYWLSDDN